MCLTIQGEETKHYVLYTQKYTFGTDGWNQSWHDVFKKVEEKLKNTSTFSHSLQLICRTHYYIAEAKSQRRVRWLLKIKPHPFSGL